MIESWRPVVCAAAFTVTVGINVADAQTVIVRNAPLRSTVELLLNDDTVGSATVVPGADAVTLSMNLLAKVGKAETSAHVFVDACTNLVRVLLVELQPPAPGPTCNRKPITGLFVVRTVTTFVVDLGGVDPAMWLRQGPAPPEWLGDAASLAALRGRDWGTPPTNLVLFGGGGFTLFGNTVASACGNVTTCAGTDFAQTYRVGAAYWIKRFVAAEVSDVKPKSVTVNGSGDGFQFQSVLHTEMITVAGNVGVPVGPVRLYGQAGRTYHRATSTTTETIDASGTQTFALKTAGWGWLFGGGAEVWMTRRLAIYAELGRAELKGAAVGGGEGTLDDHVTFVLVGGRIHIGR